MKTIENIFACPNCFKKLRFSDERLLCSNCKAEYDIIDNIPIMLFKNRNQFIQIDRCKRELIDFYSQTAQNLESSIFGRFTHFLNFGYVSDENTQYAMKHISKCSMNNNSINLFFEIIGNVDCNNKKIVDIGCGRGGNIGLLNNYYEPKLVVGVDICLENIRFCNNKKKADTIFCVADAENMPFLENRFDVVINIESSLHYQNLFRFYQNAYRILCKGGYFLYADFYPTEKFYEIEASFNTLGFEIVRKQNITSNVILSIKSWDKERKKLYIDNITNKNGLTEILDQMIGGKIEYRIYTLRKM